MPLTPEEEARLAALEQKARDAGALGGHRRHIQLIRTPASLGNVTDKLREALAQADEFKQIVIIGLRHDGRTADIMSSDLPITFEMGGALAKALVKLNS